MKTLILYSITLVQRETEKQVRINKVKKLSKKIKNLLATTTTTKNMNNNSTSKTQELAGVSHGTRDLTIEHAMRMRSETAESMV